MAILRCTVRGCGRPLVRTRAQWACEREHSFDVTRAGFVNLLQPQDKKSAAPGDARDVVLARRRLLDTGVAAPLSAAIVEILGDLPEGRSVLDVGCGEGTHLAALCAGRELDGWGVDISVPAIEAATKRHRTLNWVVANADRGLPFMDGQFEAAMSITGRRDPAEFARVLVRTGRVLIAVPAPDDLAELRSAVKGAVHEEDRLEKIRTEMSGFFTEESSRIVSHRPTLDRDDLADVLATTYRGARHSERERARSLDAMPVTFAWSVAVFRRR